MPSGFDQSQPPPIKKGDVITAAWLNEIRAAAFRGSNFGGDDEMVNGAGAFTPDPDLIAPTIPIYNPTETDVPAYGVMLMNGLQVYGPYGYVKIKRPDTFGSQANALIADAAGVKSLKWGKAQALGTFIAAYDTADGTPSIGDAWGPRSGTFLLKKNTGGFYVLGVKDAERGYVICVPNAMRHFYGRNSSGADISKGTTGTIRIFTGTFGSEVDSGVDMPNVLARFGKIAKQTNVECMCSDNSLGSSANWFAFQTDSCS